MAGSNSIIRYSQLIQISIVVFSLLPLLFMTEYNDYSAVLASFAVSVNTAVRVLFPSSYVPAAQAKPGILHNPLLARCLATIAEIIFYSFQSTFFFGNERFWSYPYTGQITLLGETVCWLHIFFQSELLGWVEDIIWTSLQISMVVNSDNSAKYLISLPFVVYMVLFHLPRMYKRWKDDSPFLHSFEGVRIQNHDTDTFLWVNLSLFLKPILFAVYIA